MRMAGGAPTVHAGRLPGGAHAPIAKGPGPGAGATAAERALYYGGGAGANAVYSLRASAAVLADEAIGRSLGAAVPDTAAASGLLGGVAGEAEGVETLPARLPPPNAAAGHTGTGYDDGVAWPNANALVHQAQERMRLQAFEEQVREATARGEVAPSAVDLSGLGSSPVRYETTSAAYRGGSPGRALPPPANGRARGRGMAPSASVPAGIAEAPKDEHSPPPVRGSASTSRLPRQHGGKGGGSETRGRGGHVSGASLVTMELEREKQLDRLLRELEDSKQSETKVRVCMCARAFCVQCLRVRPGVVWVRGSMDTPCCPPVRAASRPLTICLCLCSQSAEALAAKLDAVREDMRRFGVPVPDTDHSLVGDGQQPRRPVSMHLSGMSPPRGSRGDTVTARGAYQQYDASDSDAESGRDSDDELHPVDDNSVDAQVDARRLGPRGLGRNTNDASPGSGGGTTTLDDLRVVYSGSSSRISPAGNTSATKRARLARPASGRGVRPGSGGGSRGVDAHRQSAKRLHRAGDAGGDGAGSRRSLRRGRSGRNGRASEYEEAVAVPSSLLVFGVH